MPISESKSMQTVLSFINNSTFFSRSHFQTRREVRKVTFLLGCLPLSSSLSSYGAEQVLAETSFHIPGVILTTLWPMVTIVMIIIDCHYRHHHHHHSRCHISGSYIPSKVLAFQSFGNPEFCIFHIMAILLSIILHPFITIIPALISSYYQLVDQRGHPKDFWSFVHSLLSYWSLQS